MEICCQPRHLVIPFVTKCPTGKHGFYYTLIRRVFRYFTAGCSVRLQRYVLHRPRFQSVFIESGGSGPFQRQILKKGQSKLNWTYKIWLFCSGQGMCTVDRYVVATSTGSVVVSALSGFLAQNYSWWVTGSPTSKFLVVFGCTLKRPQNFIVIKKAVLFRSILNLWRTHMLTVANERPIKSVRGPMFSAVR